MAGPLGVSHLLLFSRSPTGNTNLRVALLPRGPTLHFRVERYALCKDVQKALRHPKGGEKEYLNPPLLVMNNFISSSTDTASRPAVPKHLETLSTTIFQSLFNPISPQSTPLSSIRRVLLLDRELLRPEATTTSTREHQYVINLRHYAIITKSMGLSKGIRQIRAAERALKGQRSQKNFPNLGNLADIADYVLDPSATGSGFTSGSESEVETDVEVEVMDTHRGRVHNKAEAHMAHEDDVNNQPRGRRTQKRAIRLVELGPRMTLRMTKVEEGVCEGKVMWHEYLHKSEAELKEMERVWEAREREKAERRRVQKENVERKRKARASGGQVVDGFPEHLAADNFGSDSEGWDTAGTEGKDASEVNR